MKKILVAINSEEMCQELADRLSRSFEVVTCQDGCEALSLLRDLEPEIGILDLMLPNMDGVSVLETARNVGITTKIVVVSTYYSPYTIAALERLRVQFLIRIGVDSCNSIVARIMDIADWEEPLPDQKRLIRNTLLSLGFRVGTSGYRYLETAIEQFMQDPSQQVVSALYPKIAALCGGTAVQVEKSIRSAIGEAYRLGNDRVWRLYFRWEQNCSGSKPSNLKFIARIAECVIGQTVSAEDKDMRNRIAL